MDDLWTKLLSGVVASGLPGVLLLFAIKWLQGNNRELIGELNKERTERISLLENHIEECDKDRKELRERVLALLQAEAAHKP
jgi:hypothetical protein